MSTLHVSPDSMSTLHVSPYKDQVCGISSIAPPKVDLRKLNDQKQRYATMWPNLMEEVTSQYPDFAELYSAVEAYNLPNFLGAK